VFDDDHYYMGGAIAERLRDQGLDVTLVTPAPLVSAWTVNTLEQARIQARLLRKGVKVLTSRALTGFVDGVATLACAFTGEETQAGFNAAILATSRSANDQLYRELVADEARLKAANIKSVTAIGDSLAPGTIAQAVFGGHRYGREFEKPVTDDVPFNREISELGPWP